MEKRKERKRKIKFNYFLKRKIVMGVCLFLILIGGVVTVFALTNKEDKNLENKQKEIAKEVPAESPYTLDELEKAMTSRRLFGEDGIHSMLDDDKEAQEMAYIYFHFYEYFSKDTKVPVWATYSTTTGNVTYREVGYDEYMKAVEFYLPLAEYDASRGSSHAYRRYLRIMMYDFVKLV